jgi:hypothetical protein
MNSAFPCQYCGKSNIRRSRRQSPFEFIKMALGSYPFRCLDCHQRFWINVWLFSNLAYAKCPKCLRLRLTFWPRRFYHLSFRKNFLITFGAHRYRCAVCRCNFLSFRPLASGNVLLASAAEEPEALESDEARLVEKQA